MHLVIFKSKRVVANRGWEVNLYPNLTSSHLDAFWNLKFQDLLE